MFELSDEQKSALKRCYDFHKFGNDNNALVLSAGAGTGKSAVVMRLWDMINEDENVALCATTNEAANVIGGQTVHKMFGMRVGQEIYPADRLNILGNGYTVIIDELSQLQQTVLDTLRKDKTMKILLVGDPNQLTVQGVPDIKDFEHVTLTHNFRASNTDIAKLVSALDEAVKTNKTAKMKNFYGDCIRRVDSHEAFLEECRNGDEVLVTAYTNSMIAHYTKTLKDQPHVKVLTVHKAQGKSYSKVCIDLANIISMYKKKPSKYQAPPLEKQDFLRLVSVACSRAVNEIVLFMGDKRSWT